MSRPPPEVPMLDLTAQFASIEVDIRAAIERVLGSQQFVLGPEVSALEQELAALCRCPHAVGVSSGTDALLVALLALGIGPGDEVITSPYTFIATANAIARVGARPVFVDIDPGSFNLRVDAVDDAVTPRTQAMMPVHLFGQVADMLPLLDIARRRRLVVIEDAAQALGAELDGRPAGSFGDAGCLSFFPSKNLGAFGDGGMIVTQNAELARRARLLRAQGQEPKYVSRVIGGNFRLDALQAAVLRAKLPHLARWTAARQQHAETYGRLARDARIAVEPAEVSARQGIALPSVAAGRRHVYNQFVIRTAQRDGLRAHLAERGIATEVYYPVPMHLQPCFVELGYPRGSFPESERAAHEALALPIYPELTAAMQERVMSAIVEYLRR